MLKLCISLFKIQTAYFIRLARGYKPCYVRHYQCQTTHISLTISNQRQSKTDFLCCRHINWFTQSNKHRIHDKHLKNASTWWPLFSEAKNLRTLVTFFFQTYSAWNAITYSYASLSVEITKIVRSDFYGGWQQKVLNTTNKNSWIFTDFI